MEMEYRHRRWGIVAIICAIILSALVVFLAVVMTRGLPEVDGEIIYRHDGTPLQITGLTQGQAAIGSVGEVKAVYGDDVQAPIASMAKVITALVVLEKNNDLNQVITIDETDVAFYNQAVAVGGSRLQVVVGEQLTLQQMLEALMVVSANNIADSLVYHLFGNHENYQAVAGEWLVKNGLESTKIGADASGLDPSTVSTPSDMIKIGQLALEDSVLSQIVKIRKATYVLEGEVENTNELLEDGYFGIKTGNTNEARSCLLFAYSYEDETIIGVLMGQPFNSTFDIAKMLAVQVEDNFASITIPAGTVVGKYVLPWGGEAYVSTTEDVSAFTWSDAEVDIEIQDYRQQAFSLSAGSLAVAGEVSGLEVESTIPNANLFWRLTHLDQLKW